MDSWLYPTPRVSPQSSSGVPWSRSERRFPWTPPIILIGACRCCRYINLQTDIWDLWPEERRSRNRYDAVADPPLVQEPSLQDKYRQIKCVWNVTDLYSIETLMSLYASLLLSSIVAIKRFWTELLDVFNVCFSFFQHLQDAQPWMDKLEQTCNQVDFIERHMKYLRCLQHIEELR